MLVLAKDRVGGEPDQVHGYGRQVGDVRLPPDPRAHRRPQPPHERGRAHHLRPGHGVRLPRAQLTEVTYI